MTNVGSVQVARLLRGACHRAGQRPDPLARNDVDVWSSIANAVIARSAQRDEAISAMRPGRCILAKRTRDIAETGVDGRDKPGHDERWVLAERTRELVWRNEPEGSGRAFWPNEPETYGRLPEPSDSNYHAYQWIAGVMISAFFAKSLVREKSYVW